MKTLSVFVAVAIVLTVMCSQQSSAVPVLQGEELEETIFLEIPDAVMDETVMDSMKVRASSQMGEGDRAAHCTGVFLPPVSTQVCLIFMIYFTFLKCALSYPIFIVFCRCELSVII
uniref:Hepcidin n=1 Tax=Gouania willdenowi TaxID=441366 RepID=A0A8C5GAD7_GOUWI